MTRSLRACLAALFLSGAPLLAQATDTRLVATGSSDARDAAIEKLQSFLTRYPDSPLRPAALLQLGELLVRRADEEYAEAQRGGREMDRPNYAPAIARYEEIVRRYSTYERADAAAYTLGTLYFATQRYADASRMFEMVVAREGSTFRPEAYFRLGDAYFEQASRERGEARRALFARAAQSYEAATTSRREGDIYFLLLYKLGWSYYNQANQANQEEYSKAVEVFGRLVSEYDRLTPEQQSRLGLRAEAIDYMAVAFTQVGGAQAASTYFTSRGSSDFKLPLLRRVAGNLRDQGDLPRAVEAYRAVIAEAPADSGALEAQRAIVDIYQNRMIEPEQAQQARIALVQNFGPGTPWYEANASHRDTAQAAREMALREAGQYSLSRAQRGERQRYADAAELYGRYLTEFALRPGRVHARRQRVLTRGLRLCAGRCPPGAERRTERHRRLRLGGRARQDRSCRAGQPFRDRRSVRCRLPGDRRRQARADSEGAARLRGGAVGRDGRIVPHVRGALPERRLHPAGAEADR
jgi:tetratricopeptide (TPR) repeat protein